MANPKINISSLDFDGIKASLKAYLSTKPQFTGYDFNGSAINILLDVMAYNTLFYGYYTNMIANETFLDTAQIDNNIIRLAAPLGVLVPNKTCAKSTLTVSGIATITSYSSVFTGSDVSGASYRFYTLTNTNVNGSTTLDVYEASTVANKLQITVDTTTQTSFLGTNIDPITVNVQVNGESWSRYDGTTVPNSSSKIFYIERIVDGFQLVFGKKNSTDYASSYGKTITANDTVLVSYLIPTGSAGNNITSITHSTLTVTKSTTTSGGSDSPDLDSVKFLAPKSFAANERAVTLDDYYSLLLSSGLLPAAITSRTQVNIWGGDDATPTAYGRTFVSFADTGITAGSTEVTNCITFLKAKSMIGVLPEYVQVQPITAYATLNVITSTSTSVSGLTGIVQSYYNNPPRFNNNIRIADIKSVASANYTNIKNINMTSLYFLLGVSGSDGQKLVHFKNELVPGSTLVYGNAMKSTGFTYGAQTIYLADTPTIFNESGVATEGMLAAVNSNLSLIGGLGKLGYVNYLQGYAVIKENVLGSTASINMTGYPRYIDSTIIKDEFLLSTSFDATASVG